MPTWFKQLLARFRGNDNPEQTSPAGDAISADQLVAMAMNTNPDEIGCDEFFERMDRFVELGLADEDVAALMPLMQDHLERCADCREEYEALQRALQAVA